MDRIEIKFFYLVEMTMYNIFHVFLNEKRMPKEHKNIQKSTKRCILLYSRMLLRRK